MKSRGAATLTGSAIRWVVAPAVRVSTKALAGRVNASIAAAQVDAWCADASVWPQLCRIYEEMTGEKLRPPTSLDIETSVKPALRRALARGTLVATGPTLLAKSDASEQGIHARLPEKIPPPPPPPKTRRPPVRLPDPEPTLDWIEIRVVDGQGNPLANQAVHIELPGGSERDVTTDDAGSAKLTDIPPGACKVSIPDIDASLWRSE